MPPHQLPLLVRCFQHIPTLDTVHRVCVCGGGGGGGVEDCPSGYSHGWAFILWQSLQSSNLGYLIDKPSV